jgi:hypothetical protein
MPLCKFVHNLLNVVVQIANKMGLQEKICILLPRENLKKFGSGYHSKPQFPLFSVLCGLCMVLQGRANSLITIILLRIHSGRCWLWCLVDKHPRQQTFTETCDLTAWQCQILEFQVGLIICFVRGIFMVTRSIIRWIFLCYISTHIESTSAVILIYPVNMESR